MAAESETKSEPDVDVIFLLLFILLSKQCSFFFEGGRIKPVIRHHMNGSLSQRHDHSFGLYFFVNNSGTKHFGGGGGVWRLHLGRAFSFTFLFFWSKKGHIDRRIYQGVVRVCLKYTTHLSTYVPNLFTISRRYLAITAVKVLSSPTGYGRNILDKPT